MVDNQHRKITGYRELSEDEIALMNAIKEKAQDVGHLVDELDRLAISREAGETKYNNDPERWVSIGRTQLQQGFMALTRSVARPDFF